MYDALLGDIQDLPKYGNDIHEVDSFARDVAYTYTKPVEYYKTLAADSIRPDCIRFQQTYRWVPRPARRPMADLRAPYRGRGIPAAGRDTHGPTAACNSVSKLDHFIASNGTLFNMKFHPSALAGRSGIESFINLIRGYFDQKGSHMQFNVVSRETLLDAQKNPEKYRSLVVRVAGYSALFTTLSRSLQDDIISRTEQTAQ